jgi:hypothetical protein
LTVKEEGFHQSVCGDDGDALGLVDADSETELDALVEGDVDGVPSLGEVEGEEETDSDGDSLTLVDGEVDGVPSDGLLLGDSLGYVTLH